MKEIYYKKVGRRYRPVSEYDSELLDSFPKGAHMVMVYPGGSCRRYGIDPAFAPMIAAGRYASDAICQAMHNASEGKPKQRPITERQRAAWQEMKTAFGDELFSLHFDSIRDIAETGVKATQIEADKLLKHESVRLAYEQFMLVCKLTKENEK